MGNDQTAGPTRDVFISYAHADADWVRTLAKNLHQSGLEVFFDEWDIGPGDVVVHKLDAGILASKNGVLVVSPVSLSRPWVQEEYAAMLVRAVAGKQRLIPVLFKDAEVPPFLATRAWVDFRTADGPDYMAKVEELVRALKGERRGPPPRSGKLDLPPGSGFTATGARSLTLGIGAARTSLTGDGLDVGGAPPRPDFDFGDLTWRLERARTHRGPVRDTGHPTGGHGELEGVLAELGARLADAFLPAGVAAALAEAVAEADRLNGTLQLGFAVEAPFADLPWETLRLPEAGALALHPRVELFRRIAIGGAAPAVSIPGPLRILVAIGSPEAQNANVELLDMEAELQRILDATDRPRKAGRAFVHILEQGSVPAIHAALSERRYHVLHISCPAAPGALILETADGKEDRVTPECLCADAIPAERAPPLVVLAGCSTARDAAATGAGEQDAGGAAKLPNLARDLVMRGTPAVIAMQASVGDRYCTDLMGTVYEALAEWEEPRALAALGHARRRLEQARQADASALQSPPEWATPAFFCAAQPLRLYDPQGRFEDLKEAPDPTFDPGVVVRRIGDMVGRRREQRLILKALRDPDGAGVLLHGIGGVGKSTLAAQVLHRLADDDGFLLISLKGETDPDRVLGAVATRLFALALAESDDEKHPLRQLSGVLREPKYPWRDRFEYLAQSLLGQVPVLFLFDNFEDNLPKDSPNDGAPPEALAALLARWLEGPGLSRLVFTCRYPFALPGDAHERLAPFHLGPLSWAETRKLLWRLDGLKALSADDQRRAYECVGGHPRALEYLDAILRGGTARFGDVQKRLRTQIKAKGVTDPARWCADVGGGLDASLAETVTLAADDVLLDQLLEQLADDPLARRLLVGSAVYRVPVDELGLIWQVGEPVEHAPDPARAARLQAMEDRLTEARKENPAADWGDVFSRAERDQYRRDFAEENRPPVQAPAGFAAARQRLMDLSLLAPVRFADDDGDRWLVHRWTAAALEKRASADEQTAAHRAAAAYWRWRVEKLPQAKEQDIADLLEARHYLHEVGDLAEVHAVSGHVCLQLETWGAWEWEERLLRETLAWMPKRSEEAAATLGQLANVMQLRGEYDESLLLHREALAIFEELGDRYHMAVAYHQLGMVAQLRGDLDAALDWYRKSLAIKEPLGDRAGMAGSYHQLGRVAQVRGDLDAALDWYRKSLAIKEPLGDRAGMARSWHQLGRVAQDRGDLDAALDWYRKSLAIKEQLGDRAGMARSWHQLGRVAQVRGDLDAALDWYRKSLAIKEQLGNRAGMASSISQIGVLHTEAGRAADAVPLTLQSLALSLQMRSPEARKDLYWLSRQRRELGGDAFRAVAARHLDVESLTNVLAMLDDYDRANPPEPGRDCAEP